MLEGNIAAMDAPREHPAARSEAGLLAECRQTFGRRSGPGGQHRNKVETAVRLTHLPTGLVAEASERRSQEQNRRAALARLRLLLALEVRTPRVAEVPSERWRARARGGRLPISGEHPDFPALLAEALDVLAAVDWNPAAAGRELGVSSSQLVRLLRRAPRALEQLNRRRAERDLRPLR